MSTALYRRYRPASFAEVIGQDHVTGPLMQALRTGRINHAYLFSGPRGCGKTTSARILARCLNCENGPTDLPCGECRSCRDLAAGGGGSVDVIEIDAASHGGVDDARELRERASYGPAGSRYKVYIIDEAHMVTPQGFNALLKIVEEPPEHVKFVFATTEPDKVIGTIRSRTHHYPFHLVPSSRLQPYLEELCRRENVQVEPGVLGFVVRAGAGSVRDSLSVLDQLISGAGPEGVTYAGAAALLGFTEDELVDSTIEAIAARDGAAVFRCIHQVMDTGHDPRRFVEDLLERFRDLIIVAAVPDDAGSVLHETPPDQLERRRHQAAGFGKGELSHAADVINRALTEMSGATAPRLHVELLCARLLLPAADGADGVLARLDRLERRLAAGGVADGPVRHPLPRTAGTGFPQAGPSTTGGGAARGEGATPTASPHETIDAGGSAPRPSVASAEEATAAAVRSEGLGAPRPGREVTSAVAEARRVAARAAGSRQEYPSLPPQAPTGPPSAPAAPLAEMSAPASIPQPSPAVSSPAVPQQPGSTTHSGRESERPAPEASVNAPAPGPGHAPGQRPAHVPAPPQANIPAPGPAIAVPTQPSQDAHPPTSGTVPLTAHTLRQQWAGILDQLSRGSRSTWSLVSLHAQVVGFDGTTVELEFATPHLAASFQQGDHTDMVQRAIYYHLALRTRVVATVRDQREAPSDAPPSAWSPAPVTSPGSDGATELYAPASGVGREHSGVAPEQDLTPPSPAADPQHAAAPPAAARPSMTAPAPTEPATAAVPPAAARPSMTAPAPTEPATAAVEPRRAAPDTAPTGPGPYRMPADTAPAAPESHPVAAVQTAAAPASHRASAAPAAPGHSAAPGSAQAFDPWAPVPRHQPLVFPPDFRVVVPPPFGSTDSPASGPAQPSAAADSPSPGPAQPPPAAADAPAHSQGLPVDSPQQPGAAVDGVALSPGRSVASPPPTVSTDSLAGPAQGYPMASPALTTSSERPAPPAAEHPTRPAPEHPGLAREHSGPAPMAFVPGTPEPPAPVEHESSALDTSFSEAPFTTGTDSRLLPDDVAPAARLAPPTKEELLAQADAEESPAVAQVRHALADRLAARAASHAGVRTPPVAAGLADADPSDLAALRGLAHTNSPDVGAPTWAERSAQPPPGWATASGIGHDAPPSNSQAPAADASETHGEVSGPSAAPHHGASVQTASSPQSSDSSTTATPSAAHSPAPASPPPAPAAAASSPSSAPRGRSAFLEARQAIRENIRSPKPAAAVEEPTDTFDVDDLYSSENARMDDLTSVGRPVIEKVLGGVVIQELTE